MSNSQFVCPQVTKEAISKEIAKALTDLCKTGGVCDFKDNETRYFSCCNVDIPKKILF